MAQNPPTVGKKRGRKPSRTTINNFEDIPGDPDFKRCKHCDVCKRNTFHPALRKLSLETVKHDVTTSPTRHPNNVSTPPKERTVSGDGCSTCGPWSHERVANTHRLLARVVLECGLSFAFVGHPAFKEFVDSFNTQYKLPCATTLSTTHLDTVFMETQSLVNKELKNTSVTLVIDESSDGVGDPIAHAVAVPPSGVPFLLKEVLFYHHNNFCRFLIIQSNIQQKISWKLLLNAKLNCKH